MNNFPTQVEIAEECWENQRYLPGFGWKSYKYSNRSYSLTSDTFLEFDLPASFEWLTNDWELDVQNTDTFGIAGENGWFYSSSWDKLLGAINTRTGSGNKLTTSIYRRRRWRN